MGTPSQAGMMSHVPDARLLVSEGQARDHIQAECPYACGLLTSGQCSLFPCPESACSIPTGPRVPAPTASRGPLSVRGGRGVQAAPSFPEGLLTLPHLLPLNGDRALPRCPSCLRGGALRAHYVLFDGPNNCSPERASGFPGTTEPVWNPGILIPRHTHACDCGCPTFLLPKMMPCHINVRGTRHNHDPSLFKYSKHLYN